MKLTQEHLKECLDYNPDTGIFTWLRRPLSHFEDGEAQKACQIMKRWNARHANTIACSKRSDGYLEIRVSGKLYLAHRLAWLYVHGYMPENKIDHFDRNRTNNRMVNLREVGDTCSMQNTGMLKNNTSGVKGISWSKTREKWIAQISIRKKNKNLGGFLMFENAVKARWKEEQENKEWICSVDSSAYNYLKENGLLENGE